LGDGLGDGLALEHPTTSVKASATIIHFKDVLLGGVIIISFLRSILIFS